MLAHPLNKVEGLGVDRDHNNPFLTSVMKITFLVRLTFPRFFLHITDISR